MLKSTSEWRVIPAQRIQSFIPTKRRHTLDLIGEAAEFKSAKSLSECFEIKLPGCAEVGGMGSTSDSVQSGRYRKSGVSWCVIL